MTKTLRIRELRMIFPLLLIGLVFWEAVGSRAKTALLISSPSKVWRYFGAHADDLMTATGQTALEAFAGIAFATSISFTLMMICFALPRLLDSLVGALAITQVIPLVTLAPLFILLFGIGTLSKVLMATLVCFFPIFMGFATGVRHISPEVRTVLYMYQANIWQRIRWAYLPQSLPSLMSGLRVASTLAVIGAIVAEFNGSDIGLGKNLFLAAKKLEPELMMSSVILSSLLGGALFLMISGIERSVGKWYSHKTIS